MKSFEVLHQTVRGYQKQQNLAVKKTDLMQTFLFFVSNKEPCEQIPVFQQIPTEIRFTESRKILMSSFREIKRLLLTPQKASPTR